MLILLPCFIYAQQVASASPARLLSAKTTHEARALATQDIREGHKFLYLRGGIASVITKKDIAFEKRYGTDLREFGCMAGDHAIIAAYNSTVFRYLDSRYGNTWRAHLREDTIGLREYISN